jgi:hypothetical protein
MNSQIANTSAISPSRPPIGRGPVVCGIWLRVAFIGASAFAVGVMQLFGDDVKLLPALALTVVSGLLTAFSARRARGALDVADEAPTSVELSARSPAGALAI